MNSPLESKFAALERQKAERLEEREVAKALAGYSAKALRRLNADHQNVSGSSKLPKRMKPAEDESVGGEEGRAANESEADGDEGDEGADAYEGDEGADACEDDEGPEKVRVMKMRVRVMRMRMRAMMATRGPLRVTRAMRVMSLPTVTTI